MPAYVLSEVTALTDAVDEYRALAANSIARHGGRYLARGVQPAAVEGAWSSEARLVLVEFPSLDTARGWYASADYQPALALSRQALSRRLLFFESDDISPTSQLPSD